MGKKKGVKMKTGEFSTLAILDAQRKEDRSNTAEPSVKAVREAKSWVDRNEK